MTRQGQATLEMTLAMIAGLMLMMGSVKVCFWFLDRTVRRQQAYDSTRVSAANPLGTLGEMWNESNLKQMRIFNEPIPVPVEQ